MTMKIGCALEMKKDRQMATLMLPEVNKSKKAAMKDR
jgi:hypothetical protein